MQVSIAALNANHKALKEHLEAIEQGQGKLESLSSRNGMEQDARIEDVKVLIGQTQEAVRNSHGALSGQIKGLGDGLADEIRGLRIDQQDKYEKLLLLIGITTARQPKKKRRAGSKPL